MGMAENFQDILSTFPDAQLLKEGGQKAAFLISHPEYGKSVLKIGTYSRAQTLERIKREVKTLLEIDSIYYPKIFDFQIFPDNRFLIIEQYVDSIPLSACLDQYVDPIKVLSLLRELVIGLKILWGKNIVHRDIKPDNLLIASDGRPIIIDLGIARLLDEESITQTLALQPKTPIYASPEQLLNRKASIDIRTDQFNLGIITLQLLLCGTHPFDPAIVASGEHIIGNILEGKWYRGAFTNPDIKILQPLIEKLLGREPYMRFRCPDNLMMQIDECLKALKNER